MGTGTKAGMGMGQGKGWDRDRDRDGERDGMGSGMGTGTGTRMRPGMGWGRGWGLGSTSFSPTSTAPCKGKVPSLEPRLRFWAGFNLQHIQVVPEPGGEHASPRNEPCPFSRAPVMAQPPAMGKCGAAALSPSSLTAISALPVLDNRASADCRCCPALRAG